MGLPYDKSIEIKNVIDKVLNIKVLLTFETLYLGIIDVLHLRRRDDYKIMRIMILASKKAITRRWRTDLVPKVDEWLDVMLSIYNMEKITAAVRLEKDNFNNVWKGWLQYVRQYRSDFV